MHLLTILFRFIWLTLFIPTIADSLDNTINWPVDDEIVRILDDNSSQFDHHEILFNSIYSMKLSNNIEYSIIVPSKYSINEVGLGHCGSISNYLTLTIYSSMSINSHRFVCGILLFHHHVLSITRQLTIG